jgi:hypothetical protein
VGLFKRKASPEYLYQQRDMWATRRAAAERDAAKSREATTELALEGGSDAAIAAAEARTRAAEDRVRTCSDTIEKLDAEITDREEKAVVVADRKQREETSRDLHARADRIEKISAPMVEILREAQIAIEAATPIVGEIGMVELFRQLLAELPPGLELVASEVRASAQMTLDRRAPATLPAPLVEAARTPPTPRQMVFALKDIKWRNPERPHEVELAERFSFANMPEELARKALETGVAILPEDDRVAKLKYNRKGAPPHPASCHDLGTGELPTPPSGPVPWNLEVINRGPPTRMTLSPPATFEPVGARSVAPPINNEPDHE